MATDTVPEQDPGDLYKEVTMETMGFEAQTDRTFESLRGSISEGTMKAIDETGFKTMTEIQAKSILKLLEGRDLRGTAKTGSGKTLAFLIPAIELMVRLKYKPSHGTGVIIISPTRELSIQTLGVLKDMMKHHSQTYGLIIGGANRQSEAKKLLEGVNILVTTPGRLLDHLRHTSRFVYTNLTCLVIDEADRILDIGFEEDMKQILHILPKRRQTMLFSATKGDRVDDFAKVALSSKLVEVDVTCDKAEATTLGLKQSYIKCPTEKRFLVLYTFLKKNLKKNQKKKVMVYFSSCMAVKFYNELLNFVDVPVKCIHGRQKQVKRTTSFFEFNSAESGILLCTDVAARGWDIPDIDFIVQYDPPDDPKEYIHRVGRTARAGKQGEAMLFLNDHEIGFIEYLKQQKVNVDPMDIKWSKIADIQAQLEKLISTNDLLHSSASAAFKGYIRSYDSHKLKNIFNINKLDLTKVGKCFGFESPPQIHIKPMQFKNRKRFRGDDHGRFSKQNSKSKRFRKY